MASAKLAITTHTESQELIMTETRQDLFDAAQQAVLDYISSMDNMLVPAPQDILSIVATDIETAQKMAQNFE